MDGKKGRKKNAWKDGVDCTVRVYLRVRPFNNKECAEIGVGGSSDKSVHSQCRVSTALEAHSTVKEKGPTTVTLCKPPKTKFDGKTDDKMYHFDRVFNSVRPGVGSQEDIFAAVGSELLDSIFSGYNACLMAYGQTSSGKTYTMTGGSFYQDPERRGVIPRLLDALFERMQAKEASEGNVHFKLEAGYMELYNEQVRDLLNPNSQKLQVREHPTTGPYADGLSMHSILSPAAILKLLEKGDKERHVRSTKMNDVSSRSHAILQLMFTQYMSEIDEETGEERLTTIVSKVSLVDLAGSERQKASGVEGDGKKEAIHINSALHCLRKVIDLLTNSEGDGKKKKVNPGVLRSVQRESLLTWLLADSLGGNSKTILIATVSPAPVNATETLSTLKYASQARVIENTVRVNADSQSVVIQALEEEIARLTEQLRQADLAAQKKVIDKYESEQQRLRETLYEDQEMRLALESQVDIANQEVQQLRENLRKHEGSKSELQRALEGAQANLKSVLSEQANSIRHQNQMSVELHERRIQLEGALQQLKLLERNYTRKIERMVKGDPQWEKLMAGATKKVKGGGGGDNDPSVVELYFTRLQNEALTSNLEVLSETLMAAFRENARLSNVVAAAMTQIADYENCVFQAEDQNASIRRLQELLEQANLKEEKYLEQIKNLSLDHLVLSRKYEELVNRKLADTSVSPSQLEAKGPELPQELREACEFFGFSDPITFSRWVVKTLGYPKDELGSPQPSARSALSTEDRDEGGGASMHTIPTASNNARLRNDYIPSPEALSSRPAFTMSSGALSLRSSMMTAPPDSTRRP